MFNYLIATDESGLDGLEQDSDDEASGDEAEAPTEREWMSGHVDYHTQASLTTTHLCSDLDAAHAAK